MLLYWDKITTPGQAEQSLKVLIKSGDLNVRSILDD